MKNNNYKNEIGKRYLDFIVINETNLREPTNGCIKWELMCIHCHNTIIVNGNNLRFYPNRHCKICNSKRKR